jgi:hypothetical protein
MPDTSVLPINTPLLIVSCGSAALAAPPENASERDSAPTAKIPGRNHLFFIIYPSFLKPILKQRPVLYTKYASTIGTTIAITTRMTITDAMMRFVLLSLKLIISSHLFILP